MSISDWSSDVCSSDLLIPYKSKNIDLSAEWYYAPSSYVSVGWFHKDVSNFLSSTRVDTTAFGLTTPVDGPRWDAAQAALGSGATVGDLRQYIFEHFPETATITGAGGGTPFSGLIHAAPGDPLVNSEVPQPLTSQ